MFSRPMISSHGRPLESTDLSGDSHCLPRYFTKQASHRASETDKMKPLRKTLCQRIVWGDCRLACQKLRIVGLVPCRKDDRVEPAPRPFSENDLPIPNLRNFRHHFDRTFSNLSDGSHVKDRDATLARDLMEDAFLRAP